MNSTTKMSRTTTKSPTRITNTTTKSGKTSKTSKTRNTTKRVKRNTSKKTKRTKNRNDIKSCKNLKFDAGQFKNKSVCDYNQCGKHKYVSYSGDGIFGCFDNKLSNSSSKLCSLKECEKIKNDQESFFWKYSKYIAIGFAILFSILLMIAIGLNIANNVKKSHTHFVKMPNRI